MLLSRSKNLLGRRSGWMAGHTKWLTDFDPYQLVEYTYGISFCNDHLGCFKRHNQKPHTAYVYIRFTSDLPTILSSLQIERPILRTLEPQPTPPIRRSLLSPPLLLWLLLWQSSCSTSNDVIVFRVDINFFHWPSCRLNMTILFLIVSQ